MEFVVTEGSFYEKHEPPAREIGRAASAADAAMIAGAHLLRYPEDVVHIERQP